MYQTPLPSKCELPSSATLLKSTVIAALAAVVILFVIVLPAEYGIDVTGAGKILGLTRMGEIKQSLAAEAAEESTIDALPNSPELKASTPAEISENSSPNAQLTNPTAENTSLQDSLSAAKSDERVLTLAPNEGKEIKLTMKQGDSVSYEWASSGGRVNFDCHADSKALKIKYHNYEKGAEVSKTGVLTAAFDGGHGWFWRNRTEDTLSVTLRVSGMFSEVKVYE